MNLLHVNKDLYINTLEQFHIHLFNYQNKSIPEQHPGNRSTLFGFVYDLQLLDATT